MTAPLRKILAAVLAALAWTGAPGQAAEDPNDQVVARVADRQITVGQFRMALNSARRERYYHAAPPESERAAFEREILADLVERALLLGEAERLGLTPDEDAIARAMDKYRAQYADRITVVEPAEFYGAIERRLREDDQLAQLRQRLEQVGEPSAEQVQAFYRDNPDKFTQPEQVRLSLILLAVDPAAPAAAWEAAQLEATQLVEEIREGADFAELAQLHSSDPSASSGGDMGLAHAGRLGGNIQDVVGAMQAGQVSDPVVVLEGVAIFKLVERLPPRLSPFEVARERAAALWHREAVEKAQQRELERLKGGSEITINEELLQQLQGGGSG